MGEQLPSLTAIAHVGFQHLQQAQENVLKLEHFFPVGYEDFQCAADPDSALFHVLALCEAHSDEMKKVLSQKHVRRALFRVLGSSHAIAEFFIRHPEQMLLLLSGSVSIPSYKTMLEQSCEVAHVWSRNGQHCSFEAAQDELRKRYRTWVCSIARYDLEHQDPLQCIEEVMSALSDAAAAVFEGALLLARYVQKSLARSIQESSEVDATRIAIIGMGKVGARELNYSSDVDVIFVARDDGSGAVSQAKSLDIATLICKNLISVIQQVSGEPMLWPVDINLRPEGKEGALVRSVESHVKYYKVWAKQWEFQALLKASYLAGDRQLAEEYVAGVIPFVWSGVSVEDIRQMRVRVTEHIPFEEKDIQLKLGSGGIRDVEFTVQLLQLVHGQTDVALRQKSTLVALEALSHFGYIGREQARSFSDDYRLLRLLEHRLQLQRLQRTHVMPREEERLRILAKSTGIGVTAQDVYRRWQESAVRIKHLHEKLFYRPLLNLAASHIDEHIFREDYAIARLRAIGFVDPEGALSHMRALTSGISRRAAIQKNLLPILLSWFSEGIDPDYGLRAFRRMSEDLQKSPWYLRLLRDSHTAARRLTHILASSQFAAELCSSIPEAVAWLDDDKALRPRGRSVLEQECDALLSRHVSAEGVAQALRMMRRREMLRLSFISILGKASVTEITSSISQVTEVFLDTLVRSLSREDRANEHVHIEFAVIGLGSFGSGEMSFASDVDIFYVFRAPEEHQEFGRQQANKMIRRIQDLTTDYRLQCTLDMGLRPEGKNGPPVRSFDSYRTYYAKWALTWEAQALLRARCVGGDRALGNDFENMIRGIRYPAHMTLEQRGEVKRMKARIENERLPKGVDPLLHVKLGRGSLSDVEWCVQMLQLRYGHMYHSLRTPFTLEALQSAKACRLLDEYEEETLRQTWLLCMRIRVALVLLKVKNVDVFPQQQKSLDALAILLGYPAGSGVQLEDEYRACIRRARNVFEKRFYE